MDFLTILKSFVDTMGATVLLPVFIFIFALILGAKAGRAFRAAVTIGVAFIGINLVIGLMWGALSGVSQALVTNVGIERDIIDVGWPAAAAVAFATDVGFWYRLRSCSPSFCLATACCSLLTWQCCPSSVLRLHRWQRVTSSGWSLLEPFC